MKCNCHSARVKRLATASQTPFVFWSAAEDGHIFQFDLRQPHVCRANDKIMLINLKNHTGRYSEIKCIAVNPLRPEQLAIGAHDCYARIYDRRMINVTEVAEYIDDPLPGSGGDDTMTSDNLPKGCVQYFCPGESESCAFFCVRTVFGQ
jgi:WD and tetratricopeptide repeats protein 1